MLASLRLEHQQEQVKDIPTDVMLIEDNLLRADKLIRNFTKRMMTDKLILCFAFVNMCALVGASSSVSRYTNVRY